MMFPLKNKENGKDSRKREKETKEVEYTILNCFHCSSKTMGTNFWLYFHVCEGGAVEPHLVLFKDSSCLYSDVFPYDAQSTIQCQGLHASRGSISNTQVSN